jgi:hypothetical protein
MEEFIYLVKAMVLLFLGLSLLAVFIIGITKLFSKEILIQQEFNWIDYKGNHYGNKIVFYKYKYFDYYVREETIDCFHQSEEHPYYKTFEEHYNKILKEKGISDYQVKYEWIR